MADYRPPRHWRDFRHRLLTGALLLISLLHPFVARGLISDLLTELVAATTILVFVAITHRKGVLVVGGAILGLTILFSLSFYATWSMGPPGLHLASGLLSQGASIAFISYIIWVILRDVLANRQVTLDNVFGAVSGYILAGYFWANLYVMIYWLDPTSFAGPGLGPIEADFDSPSAAFGNTTALHYFSFETLTTLGYGDITPRGHLTRTLAWIEAATGQTYLAVLVARLVALETAQQVEVYEDQRRTRDSLPPPNS